ncbi:LysM peptidoglycan-binding domain-containing protein [Anaerobacillus sp. MEB173]|uniref:LysM peptidoglycan-binding domain-containing protein n=1 Tax=Anaerobacillus sp. MEB173 TaxID=3383345 RepID=UPI003F90577C
MVEEVIAVTKTRKERIQEKKLRDANVRKRKWLGYAFAGTLATGSILYVGTEETSACQGEYTVQAGDTLYSLAKKHGVTVQQIQQVNQLHTDLIKVGQKLELPMHEEYLAEQKVVEQKENVAETLEVEEKVMNAVYTVAPGDTLWSIAKRFNTTISKIKADNQLRDDLVIIGQKLTIKQTGILKSSATVIGAVDSSFVEFMINGEAMVLQVAYGTASHFTALSGKKVEILYQNSNRPALVSFLSV